MRSTFPTAHTQGCGFQGRGKEQGQRQGPDGVTGAQEGSEGEREESSVCLEEARGVWHGCLEAGDGLGDLFWAPSTPLSSHGVTGLFFEHCKS